MHTSIIINVLMSIIINIQLQSFPVDPSNMPSRFWNHSGPFSRGMKNAFALLKTMIDDVILQLDYNVTNRDIRWSYSLGAIITDRQTFVNRTNNYEHLWMTIFREHGKN